MKLSEIDPVKLSNIPDGPYRPTGPIPGDPGYKEPEAVKKPETLLGKAADYALTQGGRVDPSTAKEMLGQDAMALLDSMAGMGPVSAVGKTAVATTKAPKTIAEALIHADPIEAAVTAREAGYVLPPAEASRTPTILSQALTGWGGKIKTRQAASVANQEVTNRLATEALGVPKDTMLSEQVFQKVRTDAGKAYDDVRKAVERMTTDEEFRHAISDLGGANSQAAREFPDLMKNPEILKLRSTLLKANRFSTDAAIELVKQLRFNGNANLKAIGDPSKHALGLAQREAANAIDDLIERNLSDIGNADLVSKYKAARELIAKSYDIEGATNAATGDVSARGLARLQNKGRPLSGNLKTIADTANAFPRAMQNVEQVGGLENWSALDFFGSAAALAHGNPSVAGAILLRPVARAAVLSKPYQNAMIGAKP